MNIYDVVKVLKDENYNKELVFDEGELKEKMTYPEDDFYEIKKEKYGWFFYHVNNEKRKNIKILGEYSSEDEACLYFLLNRLASYYLMKYILPVQKTLLNERDLEVILNKIGIDKSYFSYISKMYNSIYIFEDNEGWHTVYIDSYGNEYLKTTGQTKQTILSIAFMQVYSLFLIDKLINNCIERGYLEKKLDIEYILYFLGSKE